MISWGMKSWGTKTRGTKSRGIKKCRDLELVQRTEGTNYIMFSLSTRINVADVRFRRHRIVSGVPRSTSTAVWFLPPMLNFWPSAVAFTLLEAALQRHSTFIPKDFTSVPRYLLIPEVTVPLPWTHQTLLPHWTMDTKSQDIRTSKFPRFRVRFKSKSNTRSRSLA